MPRRPLEADIEGKFVDECARKGFWALKMEIPSWRNWPDRQIFLGNGYSFFIEFKRPGEEPRKGQLHRHKEIRKRGYSVYVCDNLSDALKILESEVMLNG